MKKMLSVLLVLMLMLSACIMPAAAEAVKATGSAYAMQGQVVVEVTIEEGKITAIDYVQYPETENITIVAKERIPAQIIEHQTLDVDIATGATFASNAIMGAVKNAVKASGLEIAALTAEPYRAQPSADETWDTDVLVMGGGGAGFAAAITAAQNGAKVILIEKSSVLGGNTMVAGAAYNAVDPVAQSNMILTRSQKETMDGYLALDPADPALKFDMYPEWAPVLEELKADITAFYAQNEGKVAGETMPGFDTVSLHMWHIYTGGLRQMNDGSFIAPKIELARALAEKSLPTFEWMGELGLNTISGAAAETGLSTVLGAMWPRTHSFMSGAQRIPQLEKVALEHGIEIYKETAGKELITDEAGKVIGAIAEKADGTKITINTTKGVVLATGGYCANPAMVKEYDTYWGDDLTAYTLSTNLGTNEGDGILMAQAVGADVFGMQVSQMMPSSSPVKGTMTDGIWADAAEQIWIDGNGNRFVNEYAERDVLAKASLTLDKGIFYIIYAGRGDITKPEQKITGTAYDARVAPMVEGGHIWYGDTLAELAEATKTVAAGCAPAFTEEALRATIEKYNSYVANQKDEEFGKEVLAGAIDLEAIDADPNVGICISPRKSSLHHTMGGVCINTETEVLRADGTVIEGLWAAGEVTGGVHAGNRLGGNAIADIFIFGRIAGESATK
ncbi:MAG: FAD-dependent oxidoreductase [Clostridia bacterium]|nr:FAD-dependent oxidoreductase [Clostridia bacterium]